MATGITTREGKGGTVYQVRIRSTQVGGRAICKSFKTLKEAKVWQADTLAKINKGEGVAVAAVARLTVGDAFDDYERTAKPTPQEALRIKKLRGDFENFPILNLTPTRLDAWVKELEETQVPEQARKKKSHRLYQGNVRRNYAPATVRKFFFTLKKIVEWHASFKRYPFNSPFSSVQLPREDNERERRFERGEEARLMKYCADMPNAETLETIIRLALETAMRAGELLKLTWSMVDLHGPRFVLPAEITKTNKAREIPLTTVAVALMKAHAKRTKPAPSSRVFEEWQSSQTLGRSFRLLCYTAKIDDFKFHDLRHEATSRFYERTSLRDTEIASITGHSDMRSLRRYANLRASDLALKLW